MLAEPTPIIGRASRGVYWRRHPPGHVSHNSMPVAPVAPAVAPPGSGWADWSALTAFSLTTQRPIRDSVGVPVRGLKPPSMPHRGITPVYSFRPNRRRRELTWGEASLLDAARSFGGCDYRSWDHALDAIVGVTGKTIAGTVIDKDKVIWAAQTERFTPKWPAGIGEKSFDAVISRLASDLPDRLPI